LSFYSFNEINVIFWSDPHQGIYSHIYFPVFPVFFIVRNNVKILQQVKSYRKWISLRKPKLFIFPFLSHLLTIVNTFLTYHFKNIRCTITLLYRWTFKGLAYNYRCSFQLGVSVDVARQALYLLCFLTLIECETWASGTSYPTLALD